MGYLAYIIALVMVIFSDTRGVSMTQGIDLFLDKAAGINGLFFNVSVVIWIILAVIVTIFFLQGKVSVSLRAELSSCGCLLLGILTFLPAIQFVIWKLSEGMAASWGAEGPTDPVRFVAFLLLTLLLGTG